MGFIPEITCRRCGNKYSAIRGRCPSCGARVSNLHGIPDDMRDEVQFAAIEVGAGMGRAN